MNHAILLQPAEHIRDVFLRMLDATPRELWFEPFGGRGGGGPGGSGEPDDDALGNTVAWTIGHLAWAEDMSLVSVGGPATIPDTEAFAARFAWKTTPIRTPADAPPLDGLLATLETTRSALTTWFNARSAEELEAPLTGEFASWCPVLGLLPASLAHHEAMHVGQFQVFRRARGLAPVFV
ncbi:MAG: DinB family protein [Phycisphaerales bacterium]